MIKFVRSAIWLGRVSLLSWLMVGALLSPALSQSVNSDSETNQLTGVPNIDRYGQRVGVTWPGKVVSDQQFKQDIVDEAAKETAWTLPARTFDVFGGSVNVGWHTAATGYYHVLKHNGIWWLITPLGNPCFYKGIDTAPALAWETTPITGRENLFAELLPNRGVSAGAWAGDAWGQDPGVSAYAFGASNLIRKYGPDWKAKFRAATARRLQAWGFSGFGKWSDYLPRVPSTPPLNRTGVTTLAGHPDPFDPAVQAKLHDVLVPQIAPHVTDPYIVGWSLGNESAEIITSEEIQSIVTGPGTVPAKRALIDFILANSYGGNVANMESAWGVVNSLTAPLVSDLYSSVSAQIPETDLETMRRYYADRYYALVESTVKSIDPNHLYFGFWIVPGGWENESDWWLIAQHCDVIGYDDYEAEFAGPPLYPLFQQTAKPVFCGEFGYPQDETDRGFGTFGVTDAKTEEESGKLYQQNVAAAARNPYCVGINWFQYRDEPITGRGPGYGPEEVYGENYAFGLIDIADQPKWKLVTAVRETNLSLIGIRSKLK